MEAFYFKRIISYFIMPLQLSLVFLIAGIVLLWLGKRQRLGKILATVGVCLLVLFSNHAVSRPLLGLFEHRYPPLNEVRPGVTWIVVLSAGVVKSSEPPLFSRFPASSLYRFLEGIRIWRMQGGGKVLFTGPSAELARQTAISQGIPAEDIATAPDCLDTADEAAAASRLMNGQPCILVTSASHMPRALELFRRKRIDPIAAPAEFRTFGKHLYPLCDVNGLQDTTTFAYEAIGHIWTAIAK
ncbi:MAG: YdcF family protein [Desulfobacteraceae bacterium]|nr:YdcF family protein [Desulfobacteraceae bacterium]